MKEEIICKYLSQQNIKFSEKELKNILEIVKKELSFLVRNGIPPIPEMYEKWFLIFCYLHEKKKNLSDLEIKGLYKTYYSEHQDENDSSIKDKINNISKISENVGETLKEIIDNLKKHQINLDKHTEEIELKTKEIKEKSVLDYLEQILNELAKIKEENQKQRKQLSEYHSEIVKLREELTLAKKEADIDFLTELFNRRRFFRALEEFLKDHKTKNYIFSFIILDIDNFKVINDTYGHLAGDNVLKDVASVLKFYLRANTVIGRLGGEEFGIILPGLDIGGAEKVAERLRRIMENRKVYVDNHTIKYTASFGATHVKKGDTVEILFSRADDALYKAKRKGKNKVIVKI